jgi:hypothetical protein
VPTAQSCGTQRRQRGQPRMNLQRRKNQLNRQQPTRLKHTHTHGPLAARGCAPAARTAARRSAAAVRTVAAARDPPAHAPATERKGGIEWRRNNKRAEGTRTPCTSAGYAASDAATAARSASSANPAK